jgi:hypothetical protein
MHAHAARSLALLETAGAARSKSSAVFRGGRSGCGCLGRFGLGRGGGFGSAGGEQAESGQPEGGKLGATGA